MPRLATLALSCLLLTTAAALASPKASHDATRSPGGAPVVRMSAANSSTRLFGDRSVERGRSRTAAGRAQAFLFHSSTKAVASSIVVYVDAHNKSRRLIAGLYSNSRGRPGRRLVSGSLTRVQPHAWNTVRLRSTSISARRTYWVAILSRKGSLSYRSRQRSKCTSFSSSKGNLRSLASRWRSGAEHRLCASVSVDGTKLAAALPPTSPAPPPAPTPPTPPSLPSGVTLQQIDGGPSYFAKFSNATTWDNPNFYPIAAFNQGLGYNSSSGTFSNAEILAYKNEGVNGVVNLYNGYNQGLINALRAQHMWALTPPLANNGYEGNTVNGYVWFDEPEANNHCGDVPSATILGETVPCSPNSNGGTPASVIAQVTADLHGAHGKGDPTRFVYGQYTKPVALNEGLSTAEASAYTNAVDVISYDYYVINDSFESPRNNLWLQYDAVRNTRAEANFSRPVLPFIEAGEPFTDNQWSGVTATPAMEVAEAWNAIIGGARGIQWFDHDFGGSDSGYAESGDDLIDSNPVFAGLQAAVKSFDNEVTTLAPVLDSSFANSYVSNNGQMNVMAKYSAADNKFYIFAAPRSNSPQTITFHVTGGYSGPVQVYNEGRAVAAANGSFTDTFSGQTAVHVYVVPNSG